MQLFVLTVHCTSNAHCGVCRNKTGGRKWRESISKIYETPKTLDGAESPADFECPYGKPWLESTVAQPAKAETQNTQNATTTTIVTGTAGCKDCTSNRNVTSRIANDTGSRDTQKKGCGCSRGG